MPANAYIQTGTFRAVAAGPGDALVKMDDHPGEYAIHTSTDPSGIVTSYPLYINTPVSMTLAAGEYLHTRGRGTSDVTADTLVP